MTVQHFLALLVTSFLLIGVPSLASPVGAADPQSVGESAEQAQGVKALEAEINEKLNKTPRPVFEQLGRIRSKAAFRVLQASVSKLKARERKVWAFAAMRHLLSDKGLRTQVLGHVTDVALKGPAGDAQAAVRGLAQFGEAGKEGLREILVAAKDDRTRQFAFRPLHAQLLEEGGKEVRDLVLRDFVVPESGSEGQALELIRLYSSAADFKVFREAVADGGRPVSMRRLLLRAMEVHAPVTEETASGRPKKKDPAGAVLLAGLKSGEPRLHYQALVSATVRPAPLEGPALRSVKKFAKSRDDATRRAATLLLLEKGEGKMDPHRLAISKDAIMRQAAAIALGARSGDEAFSALAKLMGDKDWTVKAEAIRGLLAQRDRRAIALFVDRINREEGRLVMDLAAGLESLTGRGYGMSPKTWRRFWNKEGEGFVMPSPSEVAKAIEARAAIKDKAEGGSVASFYGLKVVSGRFAIVFDASLSMGAKGKSGKRRIDTAKAQLKGTIDSLREGTLMNLLPFAARVEPLWEELMPMNEDTKAEALSFTKDLKMKYGTDIYDGLHTAFIDERIDTIYLLSDGASTEGVVKDPDGLKEEVARWNSVRGIKIHCIAIGTDHRLLRGLSRDSGGKYVRVD